MCGRQEQGDDHDSLHNSHLDELQVLCKPKLMPIKSITLQHLEQREEHLEKLPDMDQK